MTCFSLRRGYEDKIHVDSDDDGDSGGDGDNGNSGDVGSDDGDDYTMCA